MAHKRMKGRLKSKVAGIKQQLKQAARTAKATKKGKKMQAAQRAAAGGVAEPIKEAPKQTAKQEGPRLTKKEQRALAMAEKQHRELYSPEERILLVGEGNFSFARALCRHFGKAPGVYATAYDSERTLNTKYADASEARREIDEEFGGTTLASVDATRLHSVKEFRGAFRRIVWNFPHSGSGETDMEKNVAEHRKLLASFFKSAAKCLDPEHRDSAIHVALKIGEPYKSWKIVQTAQAGCPELELQTVVPFAPTAWPGYSHRRTAGFDERFSKDDSQELAKGAKVYVFRRSRSAIEED